MKTTLIKIAAGTFVGLLFFIGNVNASETEIPTSSPEIVENTLQLENWMTNKKVWEPGIFWAMELSTDAENTLALEHWMTNEGVWNSEVQETEKKLELEQWMTNNDNWE